MSPVLWGLGELFRALAEALTKREETKGLDRRWVFEETPASVDPRDRSTQRAFFDLSYSDSKAAPLRVSVHDDGRIEISRIQKDGQGGFLEDCGNITATTIFWKKTVSEALEREVIAFLQDWSPRISANSFESSILKPQP